MLLLARRYRSGDSVVSGECIDTYFFFLVYAWGPRDECSKVALTCMILPSFKWRAEVITGVPAPDKSCCQDSV